MLKNRIFLKYSEHSGDLTERTRFHWHLRNALWFKDLKSKKTLAQFIPLTVRSSDAATARYYRDQLAEAKKTITRQLNLNGHRDPTRTTTKRENIEILGLERLLFKSLYSTRVFKRDTRHVLQKICSKKKTLVLRKTLFDQPEKIALLSTPAINFLYLSEWAYGFKTTDPAWYLDLAQKHGISRDKRSVTRTIYLLTHVIISATLFYTRRISKHQKTHKQIVEHTDDLIQKNFKNIPLDAKLESIVAARLAGATLQAETAILNEANQSLGNNGFLVDRHNRYTGKTPIGFSSSEHRNVLFLMACGKTPLHLRPSKRKR